MNLEVTDLGPTHLENIAVPIRAYSLQVGVSAVIANRMVDGKIYGLPCEVAPMAIFYSMDAFAEAGLTERDLPKTWDMDGRAVGTLNFPLDRQCQSATLSRRPRSANF